MLRISLLFVVGCFAGMPASAETTIRVMSYNVWGRGGNEDKPTDETLAVLRAANADLIGLQETRLEGEICEADFCPAAGDSVGPALAEALGYYYYEQSEENVALWANGILSRYPITGSSQHDLGVSIDVNGQTVWLFNIHLDDEPYQPYQLLGIEYGPAPFITTAEDAVMWANQTRGPAMALLAEAMVAADGAAAVFVTGDFNEPSGHDWTDAAVIAGQKPVAVVWPTTAGLEAQGFIDTYRVIHADPVAKPAYTWTPYYEEAATDDHPDRIDFVLAKGLGLTVTDAWIVGEDGPRSDIIVTTWPSDHRASLAEVKF